MKTPGHYGYPGLKISAPPSYASKIFSVGAYLAVAQNIQGANGLSGGLAALQDQLATIVNQSNTAAANVYQPIAVDWGKLQQFEALLPSLAASGSAADYQTIGNQYEKRCEKMRA